MNLRESRVDKLGQNRQPMWLRVYDDRVECQKPGVWTRGSTDTIRYEQMAQVIVARGMVWSSLSVETNGGGGFKIDGLKKDDADRAKALMDDRIALVHQERGSTTPATPAIADQLAQLAALRESGALTDDEFSQAKSRLLGRP
ncbi:MAG TPA: SHOCT domain-containing protein [Gaiellaceae bacterium]|nr:SHOCT domain-containing protein [Gaiellaceae bacterium]